MRRNGQVLVCVMVGSPDASGAVSARTARSAQARDKIWAACLRCCGRGMPCSSRWPPAH